MLLPAVRRSGDGQSLLTASVNAAPASAVEPAADLRAQTGQGTTFELPTVELPVLPTPTPTAEPTMMLALLPTTTPTPVPTEAPAQEGAIVKTGANLRAGPGTEYAIVGGRRAGQATALTGITANGGWYQLSNGAWIAAFLVDNAPVGLPVVGSN
jgi:uncharacterized protein YgiM (DUF1202 family)